MSKQENELRQEYKQIRKMCEGCPFCVPGCISYKRYKEIEKLLGGM